MIDKKQELIRAELIISFLLRTGVIVCGAVIGLGLFLRLTHLGAVDQSSPQIISDLLSGGVLTSYQPVSSLWDVLNGIADGRSDIFMTAGLLLLIALPIVRVAMTVIVFFHERDWPFMSITLFVLAVLLSGVFLGRAL